MAREKPLPRLLSSVVANAHRVCLVLIAGAVLGLLALPLLDRPIRFEEKGLLAGVAYATIGNAASSVWQDAARIAQVAAGVGNFQRPGAAAALASELRAAGLTATQLTRPTVHPRGAPPCRCANVHMLIRSRRGDGLEALAVVTPVAFAPPPRPDPAYDGRNQSAAAAELALLTGAALALHLAGASGAADSGVGGEGGRWLARDLLWVIPDMSCGTEACLAAWVNQYHGRQLPLGKAGGTAAPSSSAAASALVRGGVIQQAVVLEALAGPGEYDTAELLVSGHEGLLPKLDMFWLLRHLFGYTVPPALWRDDQLSPGAPTLAARLHRALLAAAEAVSPGEAARSYVGRLLTGLQFAWQGAVGRPAGPHAAFKEYMVDAATVRLVARGPARPAWFGARGASDPAPYARSLAGSLELVLRSLNNLVERVHHSPFLYVLTGVERFVSVERYVGPAAALAAALQLQAAWSMRCMQQLLAAAGGGRTGGASRAWAVAAARAATRVAVLAAAAAALRDFTCTSAYLAPVPTDKSSAASGTGPPWASALAAGRGLLFLPLLEPGGAAAAAVLLGSVAGAAALAAHMAGRWAAAAWGHAPSEPAGGSEKVAGGSGGGDTTTATGAKAVLQEGCPSGERKVDRGLRQQASILTRAVSWHAERVIVLAGTAAALTPLVCLNWAAALVAGAYLAPLALVQGWAAPVAARKGAHVVLFRALALPAWVAIAPPCVLYAMSVASAGVDQGFAAANGLCNVSNTNFWYSHVVALSFWVSGFASSFGL